MKRIFGRQLVDTPPPQPVDDELGALLREIEHDQKAKFLAVLEKALDYAGYPKVIAALECYRDWD